jgi:hypothetical protein
VSVRKSPHAAQAGAAHPEAEHGRFARSEAARCRAEHFAAMYSPVGWHGHVERPSDVVRREHRHAMYGSAALEV